MFIHVFQLKLLFSHTYKFEGCKKEGMTFFWGPLKRAQINILQKNGIQICFEYATYSRESCDVYCMDVSINITGPQILFPPTS
jgi:hypothetical protein